MENQHGQQRFDTVLLLGEVECFEFAKKQARMSSHHQLEQVAKTIVVDCNGQDSRNEHRHFHHPSSNYYHKSITKLLLRATSP